MLNVKSSILIAHYTHIELNGCDKVIDLVVRLKMNQKFIYTYLFAQSFEIMLTVSLRLGPPNAVTGVAIRNKTGQ